jgi:hypothetical protein
MYNPVRDMHELNENSVEEKTRQRRACKVQFRPGSAKNALEKKLGSENDGEVNTCPNNIQFRQAEFEVSGST